MYSFSLETEAVEGIAQAVVTSLWTAETGAGALSPCKCPAPPLLPSPEHSPYFLLAAAPQQRLPLAHVYLEDLRGSKLAPWLFSRCP